MVADRYLTDAVVISKNTIKNFAIQRVVTISPLSLHYIYSILLVLQIYSISLLSICPTDGTPKTFHVSIVAF